MENSDRARNMQRGIADQESVLTMLSLVVLSRGRVWLRKEMNPTSTQSLRIVSNLLNTHNKCKWRSWTDRLICLENQISLVQIL